MIVNISAESWICERTNQSNFQNLLQFARKNRDEGYFNDVSIKVETECIPANRMILACNSPYFEKCSKLT